MAINLKNRPSNIFVRTESLVRYYDDIRKYKLLTQEEEIELFHIYNSSNKAQKQMAQTKIVNSNQRFVVAIAKKFGTNDNLLDLISEGNIGLMEAITRFDPTKGVRFSTFAVWYIRRAINSYMIRNNSLITKTNIAKTYHIVSQAKNKFLQSEGRQPTLDELKEIMKNDYNVTLKDSVDIIDTIIMSFDESGNNDDDNINSEDVIIFKSNNAYHNSYEKNIDQTFTKTIVEKLLTKLTNREQQIIKLIFGIGHDREHDLQEVASRVGLTTERVRQLKISIINKLKKEYKYASKAI